MLNLADEIVFTKTGQHLDDLQKAVLLGTLERQTYKKIAKDFDCSESGARNAGSELWRLLSEELGEEISKTNFRSAMERLQNSNVLNFVRDISDSFNICGEPRYSPSDLQDPNRANEQTSNPQEQQNLHQDLSEMPELGAFYDRSSELETLKTWIIQERSRLIAIAGISGIGKTSLAVQLVEQIKDEFDYVIWCNLEAYPTFPELQARITQILSPPEKPDRSASSQNSLALTNSLQKHRCLIILDDLHNIFASGELAGKFKPACEGYRSFFKQILKLYHQSCLLLIGWEQPREITQAQSKNNKIRTLHLAGLDRAAGRELLADSGLAQIDNLQEIMHRYQGNPFWLKSVANLIEEVGICLSDLLPEDNPEDNLLLPEDVKDSLQQQWERLSEIEKQVISFLAGQSQPVKRAKLLGNGGMPASDLLNALQSLWRRCFIEKKETAYILSPAMKSYIKGLYLG
ncbi:MAG: ATPase [Oscillatoria sp. SIO1A7]|nr:ATPase [Oscillatoria sp. SIO1A7]